MAKIHDDGVNRMVPTSHRSWGRVVYESFQLGEPTGYRIRLSDREIAQRQAEPGMRNVGIPRWQQVHEHDLDHNR